MSPTLSYGHIPKKHCPLSLGLDLFVGKVWQNRTRTRGILREVLMATKGDSARLCLISMVHQASL